MEVRKLNLNKQDLTEFAKFASQIYSYDSNWAPPVISELVQRLLDEKAPEYRNNFAYFMVYDNDKPLARLATGIEKSLNEKTKMNRGLISYFECINDESVSKLILQVAVDHLKEHGINEVVACKSTVFSDFGKGILVKGFGEKDMPILPYNHAYYADLLKAFGFKPYRHHDTYLIDSEKYPLEYYSSIIEKAKQRFKYRVESISLHSDNIAQIAEKLVSVIHQCYTTNWEIPQPSVYDIELELSQILKYSEHRYILLAYSDERLVGALMAYSDFNSRLKNYNGKLFPRYYLDRILGWEIPNYKNKAETTDEDIIANPNTLSKIMHIKSSKIAHCNMIFVVPDFQLKAVDTALISEAVRHSNSDSINVYEASTLGSDLQFISTIKKLGGVKTRTYGQYLLMI